MNFALEIHEKVWKFYCVKKLYGIFKMWTRDLNTDEQEAKKIPA